ncbi:MAG: hypothetical protein ABSA58_15845 [Acetobacteraceae bacterium]|jgi:hypothetical protein
MGMTTDEKRALKGGGNAAVLLEPLTMRLPDAIRYSGLSRSELYRRASRGDIVFLKNGNSVLVTVQSLKDAVASLPRARINLSDAPAIP